MKKPWIRLDSWKIVFSYIFFFALCLILAGCGPRISSADQKKEFEDAMPIVADLDDIGVEVASDDIGPYRVICGDILKFQMPVILRVISSDLSEWLKPRSVGEGGVEPYMARVDSEGKITLPIIGRMFVAGETLADIESAVIAAYYPKYVVNPPMVVCEVEQYRRENERVFTVMGLVNNPNAFPYPPDVQYNLMEALAFAGGLDMVADPKYVKIFRQGADGEIVSAVFGVGSKQMADAYSTAIKPGDVVYVDHTLITRTNQFLSNVFRIGVGADVRFAQ